MLPGLIIFFCLILYILLRRGSTSPIKAEKGQQSIAELTKINIGNSQQWVLIRSENINNPVILFVHGGPGTSQLTLIKNNTKYLEKECLGPIYMGPRVVYK